MSPSRLRSLALALALALASAALPATAAPDPNDSAVATGWSQTLYEAIQSSGIPPMVAARRIGYFGVAFHESVVASRRLGRSLDGQLNGLSGVPDAPAGIFWPAAANAASRRVLDGLFAGAAAPILESFAARETAYWNAWHDAGMPHADLDRAAAHGRAVADAILAWSSTDGFSQLDNCPYAVPAGEGLWRPTPPGFRASPLQPCWGQLRPLALSSGQACDPGPPPEFSTDEDSFFHQDAMRTYEAVNNLTDEQETIARFWSDDPGQTGTPPGHWLSIASQVVQQQHLDLGAAGEILARTGIAVSDAFICCWDTKYRYNQVRPVTYIQDHIDEDWMPLLGTPPFPEYTSGHSTQSGAAAHVLTEMLGRIAFTDHTAHGRGFEPRSFASFEEAAAEAAVSRLYGGIHFDYSDDVGVTQGQCVARDILSHVSFDRCTPGDIHPNGVGDGRVGVGDVALGVRKILQTVQQNGHDGVCGDLAPGHFLCASGRRRNWCPEGDGRFNLGDLMVLRRLALGSVRISCQPCPVGHEQQAEATWRPGDLSLDGATGVADAVRALRASVGLDALSSEDVLRGDVAPVSAAGESTGDGRVDIGDVVAILRASVGLVQLRWPERTLAVALPAPADRTAFTVSVAPVPAWATVAAFAGEGCDEAYGDGLESSDGAWSVTCAGRTDVRHDAGDLVTISYVSPRALDPSALTLTSEIVDGSLAPVAAPSPVLLAR